MRNTITYTSTLSPDILFQLKDYSKKLKIPKSNIIESALNDYFERLKKAEYKRSFRRARNDKDQMMMVEEGIDDYLNMLDK
jgi:hypothetical protein